MRQPDVLQRFAGQNWQYAAQLETAVDALQEDPHQSGAIRDILQSTSRIKAACLFLGLPKLGRLTHALDRLLSCCQRRGIAVPPECRSLMQESARTIRELVEALEATGAELPDDVSDLTAGLQDAAADVSASTPRASLELLHPEPSPGSDGQGRGARLGEAPSLGVVEGGSPRPSQTQGVPPVRVLVSAGSLFFRHLVAVTLESAGYEVTSVESADQAADALRGEGGFEVLVFGVAAWENEELERLERLSGHAQSSAVPLLAVCADGESADPSAPLRAGAVRCLQRFGAGELTEAVGDLCRDRPAGPDSCIGRYGLYESRAS